MSPPPMRYHLAAAGLILLSVALHVVYLIGDCPLDLAPDEAHYWHWSRNLDWSYYSKGPLVAWLIRGSCELFGPLSVRLVGSEMPAVRLPAVASHAALLAGLCVLANGALRSPQAGLAVVALALTLPPVAATAVVMTIDPPFLACWCWALVGVMKATRPVNESSKRPRSLPPPLRVSEPEGLGRTLSLQSTTAPRSTPSGFRWWLFAGVCSCLGVLAKYPMLMFPPAVVGFLLARRRDEFRRPGVWAFLGFTLLGCVPVVVWNAGHDWVSVRHVLGQAGVGSAKHTGVRWFGPVAFAGGQFGLLLGFWFVAFAAAAWRFRPSSGMRGVLPPRYEYVLLWWASVPVWLVFALASFRAAEQVNWPAAAYIGGLVLAVAWLRTRLVHPNRAIRRVTAVTTAVPVVLGLGLSVVAHFPGLARPALAALAGPPTEKNPTPIRKLDPTCRLRGWRTLAREIDSVRDRVKRETGQEPVIAGMVWTTPGELAFYCHGHPDAYSFGLALADRHSQYDVWHPNPVADAQAFRGRSFVYVGDEIPGADAVFDRVERPVSVVHTEDGVPVAAWTVWVGHGFRGFGHTQMGRARPGF